MKLKFPTIAKTATYGLMHVTISFFVSWFVTYSLTHDIRASFVTALGISILEPSIQIVGYYFHEKAWIRWGKNHPSQAAPEWNVTGCAHHHHDGHHHGHNHHHKH